MNKLPYQESSDSINEIFHNQCTYLDANMTERRSLSDKRATELSDATEQTQNWTLGLALGGGTCREAISPAWLQNLHKKQQAWSISDLIGHSIIVPFVCIYVVLASSGQINDPSSRLRTLFPSSVHFSDSFVSDLFSPGLL